LAPIYLNKFATKQHQAHQYLLKFIDVMPCELEFEPMPNVMAALPDIGGALCSMPQSLADAHY